MRKETTITTIMPSLRPKDLSEVDTLEPNRFGLESSLTALKIKISRRKERFRVQRYLDFADDVELLRVSFDLVDVV